MYYASGVKAALETYGVRTASLHQRMPEGPMHLGAERLTRMLAEDDDGPAPERRTRKDLNKPVRWGAPGSLESSSPHSMPMGGLGTYGGV